MQGTTFAVELSEPIEAAVSSLRKLEARAVRALAKGASEVIPGRGGRADQILALLQLARWLQIYIIGDAENVDASLVDDLVEVFKRAFGKPGRDLKCKAQDVDITTANAHANPFVVHYLRRYQHSRNTLS